MENNEYQYTENPFYVTRRQFITISGLVIALLALPAVWTVSRNFQQRLYSGPHKRPIQR